MVFELNKTHFQSCVAELTHYNNNLQLNIKS